MARHYVGASPAARFSQSRRLGKRQGRYREVGSIGALNPKRRGDEQELDMRRGAFGASGHVTAKPSICVWDALCKSSARAVKVTCLTPGYLISAQVFFCAEHQATDVDRW